MISDSQKRQSGFARRRRRPTGIVFATLLTGLLAAGCATPPEEATVRVAALDTVMVTRVDGKPNAVKILAAGRMTHGGNRDTQLRPVPAEDRQPGSLSFELVTNVPMGQMMRAAIQPVSATLVLDPAPAGLRTVRVFGQHDVIDAKVPSP